MFLFQRCWPTLVKKDHCRGAHRERGTHSHTKDESIKELMQWNEAYAIVGFRLKCSFYRSNFDYPQAFVRLHYINSYHLVCDLLQYQICYRYTVTEQQRGDFLMVAVTSYFWKLTVNMLTFSAQIAVTNTATLFW